MPSPFVRVAGLTVALAGCPRDPLPAPERPAPATPEPAPAPAPAPSEALPSWDEVPSSHPIGATNPPRPLLVVSREPPACFKRWVGGMMRPGPQEAALDGEVVATPAEAVGATPIACPPGQPAALLAAYEAWRDR